MWIKTQDGKRIINTDNVIGIGVSRRIHNDGSVDIYATTVESKVEPKQPIPTNTCVILGTYPRETVQKVFDDICRESFTYIDLSSYTEEESNKTDAE